MRSVFRATATATARPRPRTRQRKCDDVTDVERGTRRGASSSREIDGPRRIDYCADRTRDFARRRKLSLWLTLLITSLLGVVSLRLPFFFRSFPSPPVPSLPLFSGIISRPRSSHAVCARTRFFHLPDSPKTLFLSRTSRPPRLSFVVSLARSRRVFSRERMREKGESPGD